MAVSLSDSPPSQGPICPVCFRDYSDSEAELIPRILQCGHTYCTQCLERLLTTEADEDEFHQVVLNIRYAGREWRTTRRYPNRYATPHASNELKCPTCNSINRIRNGDVTNLTKNFALLSCRPQSSNQPPQRSRHYCKEHDHEKRIYCNACKVLVCAYCQLYGEHKGHDCVIATEASQPSIRALKMAEENLSGNLEQISQGEEEVSAAMQRLERQHRKCEVKVKAYYERLANRLAGQRAALLARTSNWSDEQLFVLQAQLDSLRNERKDCEAVLKECQSLIEGDPIDALVKQKEVIDGVGAVCTQVSELCFHPIINPTVKCTLTGNEVELLSKLLESCKVVNDMDGEERSGSESSAAEEEEESQSKMNTSSEPLATSVAACSSDEELVLDKQLGSNIYSQETQDHTHDLATALPRPDSAVLSGVLPSNGLYGPLYTTEPPRTHFDLPDDSVPQQAQSSTSANNTATCGSLFSFDPLPHSFLPQTSSSTSTMLNFFNPISTKPKNTNLLQGFSFSVPQPALDESGSNSEDEGSLQLRHGHRDWVDIPVLPPLENTNLESRQEEVACSNEDLFRPMFFHHAGIPDHPGGEFVNSHEHNLFHSRRKPLDVMSRSRRKPLDVMPRRRIYALEDADGGDSLLNEEHEPQNGIMPSGHNGTDYEVPTGSFHSMYSDDHSCRSAHSDPPSSQEDKEHNLTHANLDFNSDDEIVYPITQYSWQSDTGNQSLTLEIDHNGGSVQVSIQAQPDTTTTGPETSDMELTDLEDQGDPEVS